MKNYKRESNSIYKYTLANLNLRSSKSTSGDIITVIPQGSKVEILDGAEDWYEVIYNNQRGYVYNQYLSKTKYIWTDVFLRSFPTSESNSVALVPDKSIVQVLSSNGDWDHVIFNDKEGYIFITFYLMMDILREATILNILKQYDQFVNENNIKSPTII